VRSGASGSGTSIDATCGLLVRRSLTLDSRGSISTNARFSRLMYGLDAQLSSVTRCVCSFRPRRSPDGAT
jgi:hypothetical protein